MNRHRLGPTLALFTLFAAHAAVPPRKPAPPSARAVKPTAAPRHHGVMGLLERSMTGQRVICVGASVGSYNAKTDPSALARAGTLREKATAIANAASTDDAKVLSFQVGDAFVLAPEKREDVDPGVPLTLTNVMGEGARLNVVLADIAPSQIAALGSDAGLAVSDLSPEAQEMIAGLLKPPLRIQTLYSSSAPVETVTAPLDLRTTRLRARLCLFGAWVPTGNGSAQAVGSDKREVPSLFPPIGTRDASGVTIPYLRETPNGFRPSDLEGKGYAQPIGVSGAMPMSDVLKRLSAVTGLHIVPARVFSDVPVFLGSASLTAGEVIDGLRLGTTGAFRHLGNTYILAWDRWGLGAIQQYTFESRSLPIVEQAKKKIEAAIFSPNLALMARDLPFDPDDPLALTKEQQARLFDTTDNPAFTAPVPTYNTAEEARASGGNPRMLKIPFSDMTERQRNYLRDEMATTSLSISPPGPETGGKRARRPMTETDLAGATLTNWATITLSVSIPGKGWVPLHNGGYNYGRVFGDQMPAPGRTRDGGTPSSPPEPKPLPLPSEPFAIPAVKRAVALPILGPGRITELAGDLKRHGFNVVFYPALDGGYASFANPAFPTAPILRERNGLADAVAAMSAQDIEVVPYISVLAWQRPGDTPHWLDKHPDWLDVDILGRTRLEYTGYYRAWSMDPETATLGIMNFVRPDEPLVRAKLDALLATLAKQPGFESVAFLDWRVPGGSRVESKASRPVPSTPDVPPPLGYSLPSRVAAFAATGEDPVDRPFNAQRPWDPFWPKVLYSLGVNGTPDESAPTPAKDPAAALLKHLLADAKAERPDWKPYVYEGDAPNGTRLSRARGLDVPADMATWVPLWRRGTPIGEAPPQVMQIPAIVLVAMDLTLRKPDAPLAPLAVLDFRAIPDEIDDSLQWITGAP